MPVKKAVEAEVTGEMLSVEWGGFTYEVPASLDDCDIEVLEAFENGKATSAIAGVLGRAQWAQLKARSKPKVRDLNSIMEKIAEVYGFSDAGE